MGQQQMLLIVLGLIMVAVAIAIGINLFAHGSVSSNRDALINDINHIAAQALGYRIKLRPMGGGGGSYVGYVVPERLTPLDDGSFDLDITEDEIEITATSAFGYGTVTATIDSTGTVGGFVYVGEFE